MVSKTYGQAMMEGDYLGNVRRRLFLGRSGATVLGSVFGGLLAGIEPARAQALTGPVPEVDRLAVRVVTDSAHHAFEPTRVVGDLQVQRFGFALSKDPPARTLQSEWGLSLHCESTRGAERRQILVDFGYTAATLLNNLELLGIDPAQLDALVLSHGHFDHFGGMAGFLQATKRRLRPGLPFVLGGEECFCTREAGVGAAAVSFGSLDRRAIADAGLQVLLADQPAIIAGHAFTSGRIARASFEKVLSPTSMKVGLEGGIGCAPDGLDEDKRAKTIVPDDFEHELATCFHVRGKGLVVMTSCGHRGVVNSVLGAMKVAGIDRVHAVLGGFHLVPHDKEYLRQTVAALKRIDPDFLIPMHCTGEAFVAIAMQEMPLATIPSSTGTRYVFGA